MTADVILNLDSGCGLKFLKTLAIFEYIFFGGKKSGPGIRHEKTEPISPSILH
jgi:hypothetical protein